MTDLDSLPPMLDADPHVTGLLGVSRNTVYRMIKNGEVPHVRVGPRLVKVPRDKFLRQLGLLDGGEPDNVVPIQRHATG